VHLGTLERMRRTLVLVVSWVIGTVVAVGLGLFAVGLVSQRVASGQITPPLHAGEVVSDIGVTTTFPGGAVDPPGAVLRGAPGPTDAGTGAAGPGTTTPAGAPPTSAAAADPAAAPPGPTSPTPSSTDPANPADPADGAPTTTVAPTRPRPPAATTPGVTVPPTTSAAVVPPTTEAPAPAPPPSTTEPARRAAFDAQGGTVYLTCNGSEASATATAAPGFRIDPHSTYGPGEIDVEFKGDGQRSEIRAGCVDGLPTLTQPISETSGD
jgi:hypothetical protein